MAGGEALTYREIQVPLLLEITEAAIDNSTNGFAGACPCRHQTTEDGIGSPRRAGHKDYSPFGDRVNLRLSA